MIRQEDERYLNGLITRNLISKASLKKISRQDLVRDGLTRTITRLLHADEEKCAIVLAEDFTIPFLRNVEAVSWIEIPGLSAEEMKKKRIVPIILEEKEITIALIDPPYQQLLDLIARVTSRHVVPVVVTVSDFDHIFHNNHTPPKEEIAEKVDFDSLDIYSQGLKWAQNVSIRSGIPNPSELLNLVIQKAVDEGISDVHFETGNDGFLSIRVRLNGVLERLVTLPKVYETTLPRILKQAGSIDPFKRKGIHEGQLSFQIRGKTIHGRVNVIPTHTGEKLCLRLLRKLSQVLPFKELGMTPEDLERLRRMISAHSGIVLFAGPAGCGKTTSFYSALNALDRKRINISTIEAPVECNIDGISQTNLSQNDDFGITEAVRALFHHDIDVLGIGEIRNKESAELLIEAGLSGLMAFSTVQAADSIKTIFRLANFGIQVRELAMVLNGIVSQRMVRSVCPHCAEKYRPEKTILTRCSLANLPESVLFVHGKGCDRCQQTGYKNSIPLFETLLIDEELSSLIFHSAGYVKIKQAAEGSGFTSLFYDGLQKALAGLTTLDEVLRVAPLSPVRFN